MGFRDSYQAQRARLAAPESATPVYSRQPTVPMRTAETVLVPLFCSVHAAVSLLIAEKQGNRLKLIRCELMPQGLEASEVPPLADLGTLNVDAAAWAGCALCGATQALEYGLYSLWWCQCPRCNGLMLHCPGHRNGQFRGACGGVSDMSNLLSNQIPQVQGWRRPVTTMPATYRPEPPPYHAPSPLLQLPAPPTATLRIGFRGR